MDGKSEFNSGLLQLIASTPPKKSDSIQLKCLFALFSFFLEVNIPDFLSYFLNNSSLATECSKALYLMASQPAENRQLFLAKKLLIIFTQYQTTAILSPLKRDDVFFFLEHLSLFCSARLAMSRIFHSDIFRDT